MLSVLPASRAAAEDIPLFIFAGQSNMVGFGTDSSALSLEQQAVQPNVLYPGQQQFPILAGNMNWQPLQPPTEVGGQIFSGQGFGPEISTPLTISNGLLGQKVGAIKWAVNDTGIRVDPGFDWNVDSPNEIYDAMVDQVNTAKAQLPLQQGGTTGTVSGLFWYQGERDATDADRADVYQYNLTRFIEQVRTDFGDPNLPIVLAKIDDDSGTFADVIRRAQENIARYVPNVAVVETEDLGHHPTQSIHLSTQGTYDLGVRMGKAYRKLVNPNIPTGPASMNSIVNGGFEGYAVSSWGNFPTNAPVGSGTFFPSNPVPGWSNITGDGHTLVNGASGFAPASEGDQFLSLQNSFFGPGNGGAEQDVVLTPGATYTVVFDYSAISFGNDFTHWEFTFDTNSTALETFSIDTTVPQNQMQPWQTALRTFQAAGAADTVSFLPTVTNGVGFFGPVIDNVRLVEGSVWDDPAGGNDWGDSANWLSGTGTPNSNGAIANFLDTSTNKNVNVAADVTVGSIRIDSDVAYALSTSNGSKITLNNAPSAANASILVNQGAHSINLQLDLDDDVDVAIDSGTLTINGAMNQVGATARSLRKFGQGNLTLTSSAINYTGTTEVVAGQLVLENGASTNLLPFSPVVRVWEDATLDARGLSGGGLVLAGNQSLQGGGRIRGGVNATASGTSIVPGTSVGQMTFTDAGAITLDSSTTVVFEVGGNGLNPGTAGVSYDQIVIDGSGVGGGGKVLTLDNATLQLVALPGLAYNTPYRLITTVGNASINVASAFAGLAEGPIHEEAGLFFQVNYDNSFFDVTFYVPEPSSLSLLVLGVGGLLRRRRR